VGLSLVTAESNAAEIVLFFGQLATLSGPAAQASLRAGGELLLEDIQNRISIPGNGVPSSPGEAPRRQGLQDPDYHDSWGIAEALGPADATVIVGTDAPQAARLEWGFHGTDSLGRHVDQAPRPHVGPACDDIEAVLAEDLLDKLLYPSALTTGLTGVS
jgi:hypothetical protein